MRAERISPHWNTAVNLFLLNRQNHRGIPCSTRFIMSVFVLPSAPSERCLDRFSILQDGQEDGDGLVPFWPLLVEVLRQPVRMPSQLIDVLDTISNSLRGSSGAAGDYGTLEAAVQEKECDFFGSIWPKIVRLALMTPRLYPEHCLPILKPGMALGLSRDQAGCLVSHQFLCTLRPPPWRNDFVDFGIWYGSSQRHPQAVEMYLNAIFGFFKQVGDPGNHAAEEVGYALHSYDQLARPMSRTWQDCALSTAVVVRVNAYSTEQQELQCQGIESAVVVSANKDIGFGQSATQEELYMGNCPEACPAVLVTPTLADDQVLVIQGATPMLRISGQRRDVSWSPLEESTVTRGGRMLFMDALEIDEGDNQEGLADLLSSNIDREIKKAYTAFSSWAVGAPATVWTGLWGCGAFNGDPGVKMTLLWIAGSLAGKELRIICDSSNDKFASEFEAFIAQVLAERPAATASGLIEKLQRVPHTTERLASMRWLLDS